MGGARGEPSLRALNLLARCTRRAPAPAPHAAVRSLTVCSRPLTAHFSRAAYPRSRTPTAMGQELALGSCLNVTHRSRSDTSWWWARARHPVRRDGWAYRPRGKQRGGPWCSPESTIVYSLDNDQAK